VAYEQSGEEYKILEGYRKEFTSASIDELFAGSAENMATTGSRSETARQHLFGRLSYNFQEKYLIDFNARYDGSYAFPKENRWGFFPGVSVAWRVSEEDFFDNTDFIYDLKLRGSTGQVGNDRVSAFQYLSMYNLNPTGTHFGGGTQPALIPGVAPNKDITWEVATTSNIGIDAKFLEGGLGFTIDVFKQKRSNILTTRSAEVPIYTGLVLPDENVGIIENKGFETSLTYRSTPTASEFSYSIGGNFAFAKNKVLDISEPQDLLAHQKAEGYQIGAPLLYNAIGIIRTEEQLNSVPVMAGSKVGDLMYEDVAGDGSPLPDGKITAADRQRIDKGTIPEITYGFNAGLNYKNLSFYTHFSGQARASTYLHKHCRTTQNGLRDLIVNRYTPGSMDSKYPILPFEDAVGEGEVSGMPSTFWQQSAAFLRLKTVQIGYDLPSELCSKIGLGSVMVYLNGSNLLTFTKMEWYDPEGRPENSSAEGISYSTGTFYPQTKIYNVGVEISF
jgi:TonB-linked SusC/RagA family outer membrane protein